MKDEVIKENEKEKAHRYFINRNRWIAYCLFYNLVYRNLILVI